MNVNLIKLIKSDNLKYGPNIDYFFLTNNIYNNIEKYVDEMKKYKKIIVSSNSTAQEKGNIYVMTSKYHRNFNTEPFRHFKEFILYSNKFGRFYITDLTKRCKKIQFLFEYIHDLRQFCYDDDKIELIVYDTYIQHVCSLPHFFLFALYNKCNVTYINCHFAGRIFNLTNDEMKIYLKKEFDFPFYYFYTKW